MPLIKSRRTKKEREGLPYPLLPTTITTECSNAKDLHGLRRSRFTCYVFEWFGMLGCLYVSFVSVVTLLGSTSPNFFSITNGGREPASTCYSALEADTYGAMISSGKDETGEGKLLPLKYRHNGKDRWAPLPHQTPWIDDASGPEDDEPWSWPSGCYSNSSKWSTTEGLDLWYIRGVPYDLNEFAHHHPGGFRYIQNSANLDITELFESHHIGTTAEKTLEKFRYSPPDGFHQDTTTLDYKGHKSLRFKALKAAIRESFDLNDLKEPAFEYTICFWTTLVAHVLLMGSCLMYKEEGTGADSGKRTLGQMWYRPGPWMLHTCLGLSGIWLGGFAHNGLHMWSRRKFEALIMYLLACNNPFQWMSKHLIHHHAVTNTAFDGDKTIVGEFQEWVYLYPRLLLAVPLFLGDVLFGLRSALRATPNAASETRLEHMLPLVCFSLHWAAGLWFQGRKWIPRYLYTLSIMGLISFVFIQVSHYQLETLDGDNIHATVDDWGEWQLGTTWGWSQLNRPLLNVFWLNLNQQPGHHLFPAIHHSKLRLITPLIREHYPGLMEDHSFPSMVSTMFRIMFRKECLQPEF